MSKFVETLTQSQEGIKKERAENLASRTKLKQQRLVDDLQAHILDINSKISELADIAPDSTTSLKMKDIDPEEWVRKMQKLKEQRIDLQVKLNLAEATKSEWFGEEEGEE